MGSVERRERERQEVRGAILGAARTIMSERGYEGLTMRAVADRIEYSAAAIYKHFADREDLVRALCECDFYAFAQELQQRSGAKAPATPLDRLRAIGHSYAEFAIEYPEQFRVMFMTPRPIHELPGRGNPEQDAYATLEQAVGAAIAEGHFPGLPADLVAQTAWAAVHGVVSLEVAHLSAVKRHIVFAPLADRVEAALEGIILGMETLGLRQKPPQKPGSKPGRRAAPRRR